MSTLRRVSSGSSQTGSAVALKLDLLKLHKADYVAPRKPVLLDIAPAVYLAVDGTGAPGGPVFQSRVAALYAVAFTVKMTRKFAGHQDYSVGRLECRYPTLGIDPAPDREMWSWQLLILTPAFITAEDLATAVATLRKRGKAGDAEHVAVETLREGRCVQMLHVGPYDKEQATLAAMRSHASMHGLDFSGPHHEIYISDPRRVAPEKLKTILRMPVAASRTQ